MADPTIPMVLEQLPSIDQIIRFAPVSVMVVVLMAIGAGAAWWMRGHETRALRDWIDELKRGGPS